MFTKLKKRLEEENTGELLKGLTVTGSTNYIPALSSFISGSASNLSAVGKISASLASSTAARSRRASASESSSPKIACVSLNHNQSASPGNKLSNNSKRTRRSNSELVSLQGATSNKGTSIMGHDSQTPEKNMGAIRKKAEPMKVLEAKVKDLHERLENQKKEHEVTTLEKLKQAIFENDDKWIVKLQALEKEKLRLENKLQECQIKLEKFVEKQEEKDEQDNFQNQEIAEKQHLLLISYQHVKELEEKLKRQNEEMSQTDKKVKEMEDRIEQLQAQIEKNEEELSRVWIIEHDKAELELEVDQLKHEALQTSSILEAKDSHIVHVEERVAVLEKRLEDSSLPDDEKVRAYLSEREHLEKKLKESREHLSEVKSTWSEKNKNLETQISLLNKKITEDGEEFSKLEKQLIEVRKKAKQKEEEVWTLEEKIQERDKELARLRVEYEEEISKLTSEAHNKKQELEGHISLLGSSLSEMTVQKQRESDEAQRRINDLMAAKTKYLEKETGMESQMAFLRDENIKLKEGFRKKEGECEILSQRLHSSSKEFDCASNRIEQLEKELKTQLSSLEEVQEVLKQREAELHTVTQEKDSLMIRNAERSNQLELVRQELRELKMQQETEEVQGKERKIDEFEKQATQHVELSARVLELKSVVEDLEEQLADRNKTIKLQQQRLVDMKKTLQKEFRAQKNNDNFKTSDSVELGSSFPSHLNVLEHQGSSHNQNHLDLKKDDVNFKYLRHVILKFMTSRECEAQQLIRAVSVLLHFTPEEERLIKETVNWKMSWFGTKPELSKGHLKSGVFVPF
ncbi:golgin subfamily A member 1-like isoform X1 [Limulus polyphemus]|uniref:Golgin subfamily A member 1-like isoform X1 n=1 Tax=Limulus polyphemus TaxID=6850 RepID=A0ABM1BH04_LIMPO|nr:golgin subfamily A member 1-like isoform X1 [Limulus polyphemus]